MFDPSTEDEDSEAREQRRDKFLRFGPEQINQSLSDFGETDKEDNSNDRHSLLSIPSVCEVGEEEEEEVVNGGGRPVGSGQDLGLGGGGWLGAQPHQVRGGPLHQGQAGRH